MRAFNLVPANTKIDFMSIRLFTFAFSALLVLASIGVFLVQGLNFGIDFKGGILIEARFDAPVDIASLRAKLARLDLGEVSLQEFGEPDDVLIRVQRQEGDEKAQIAAIEKVKAVLGEDVEYRRTEFVGPKVGAELIRSGILAVVLAIIGILVYIWFRFELQFGVGAIIALIHDVISTIGIYSLLQLEFNLATVAAVLTIAGYSINDTVVVYDRVRENLRKYKKMDLAALLNRSINETLSRTSMTSLTTILALLALYIFGGPVIRGFSFALIWGVVIGTYSSIFVAAPLLLYLKLKRGGAPKGRKPEAAAGETGP